MRSLGILGAVTLILASCGPLDTINIPQVGMPGMARPGAIDPDAAPPIAAPTGTYVINQAEADAIPARVTEQVNMLRANSGLSPLTLNTALQTAAAHHARDMSQQNRAWHFGSDGSSPLDRAQRAGYHGVLVGEDIAESYENDIQTLSAWMAKRETRDVIMDPSARDLGIAWFQEPGYKIWWTIMVGR